MKADAPDARTRGNGIVQASTLFIANIVVLWVMAAAFLLAGWRRRDEAYWQSWALANVVLGLALLVFTVESRFPALLVAALPNGLLVLGMALRWRAAREFSGRPTSPWLVWGPPGLFLVTALIFADLAYGAVFTIVNVILALQTGAAACEFWRDRADGLPSRYGLAAAYALMAASFGVRVPIGLVGIAAMPSGLPLDTALVIHLLVALVHTTASGAFALSLAHERANARLSHAASHDPLTGVPNRGAFDAHLRAILRAGSDRPFALALLDIDHFKRINDRFGHLAGDEALRQCARICQQHIRKGDTMARIGGEEFAILLMDTTEEEACATIDRLRAAIASTPVLCADHRFRLTLSGGICHSSRAPAEFEALVRLADNCLYEAKHKGRNRIARIAA